MLSLKVLLIGTSTLLLLLLLTQSLACDDGHEHGCGPPSVICYFTNWAFYRKDIGKFVPANISVELCTHVLYAFAMLDEKTLTIAAYDTWADIDNSFYELITALKELGIIVILSIGGWNESSGNKYSMLINNPAARANFITHSIIFLKTYGFLGLDFDYEYPGCQQGDCTVGPESEKSNFALFIKELKIAYEEENLLVSLAVPASQKIIDHGYDIPTISNYADFISVMLYDIHVAADKVTGANSPLLSYDGSPAVIQSLEYLVSKGADPCKLMVGIPMYARTFTLTNPENHYFGAPCTGNGQAGYYTGEAGFLAFYEICLKMKHESWHIRHTIENSSYTYQDDQFASYCGLEDIYFRTYLIKSRPYKGAMIWAMDLDDFGDACGCGKYPLLTAINIGLGRISPVPSYESRQCCGIDF